MPFLFYMPLLNGVLSLLNIKSWDLWDCCDGPKLALICYHISDTPNAPFTFNYEMCVLAHQASARSSPIVVLYLQQIKADINIYVFTMHRLRTKLLPYHMMQKFTLRLLIEYFGVRPFFCVSTIFQNPNSLGNNSILLNEKFLFDITSLSCQQEKNDLMLNLIIFHDLRAHSIVN